MNPAMFQGQATMRSSSATQIKLRVTGSDQLVGMTVDLKSQFGGTYNSGTKSAVVSVGASDFTAIRDEFAGGAQQSISLSVDSAGAVTQFCYAGTCISASAGLRASAPILGVSAAATDDAATGTTG